jgi:hypothetical protein
MGNTSINISDEAKALLQNDLDNIHQIFKRPILIFRQAERVIISENLNYNFAYGDNQNQNDTVSYNIASGVFDARIWYMPGMSANKEPMTTSTSDREFSARGEPQLRFRNDKNYIRLKLDVSGFNFIDGAKTVEIDGENYNFFSAPRRNGLFTPQYWTLWLEQSE